ncbi:tail fiber domain-containing protein [Escherichia coli]
MPIDNQPTDRLGLTLPNEANTLKHDVSRLVNSFNQLEEHAAVVDDNGKLLHSQYDDTHVAILKAPHLWIDDGVIPSNIPRLDAKGKIDDSHLNDDVKTAVHTAVNELEMVTITTATPGDICNMSQAPFKSYILIAADPSIRNNWREIPARAVTTVNGATGDVVVAAAGDNNDITSLTGLKGALSLGGPGQADFDAVTVKQLRDVANMGAGGGVNMSGVMNNFIGAVEWFNGSAKLPAGYIPANGNCYSQTDPNVADLWAAVKAGLFNAVKDEAWLNAPAPAANPWSNRASYSLGGDSNCPDTSITGPWFRVPDLNAGQTGTNGTPGGMFLSGIAAGTKDAQGNVIWPLRESGKLYSQSAPNIVGQLNPIYSATAGFYDAAVGAFSLTAPATTSIVNVPGALLNGVPVRNTIPHFSAKDSDSTYGLSGRNLNPNTAVGIWIIRANAAFEAPSTNFNVIASDATDVVAGKTVYGGNIKSRYNVNGVTRLGGAMYVDFNWKDSADNAANNIDIFAYNADGTLAANNTYKFYAGGTFQAPSAVRITHASECTLLGFAGDNSFAKNSVVSGHTYNWHSDGWQTGIRRGDSTSTKEWILYFNGGTTAGGGREWRFERGGNTSLPGYVTAYGASQLANGYKEGSRFISVLDNDSANRQFGLGITQPPNGATYGQLWYGDSAKGASWFFYETGGAACGTAGQGWATGSDERIKRDIECVPNALEAVCSWRGAHWHYRGYDDDRFGFGLVAQDVEATDPRLVQKIMRYELPDGTVIEDGRTIAAGDIAAAYHTEAIKELKAMIDDLRAEVAELKAKA